jgi:uncharacterized lipoprotein YddW (UPF0748 family)
MERRVSVMASGIRFARPLICSCLVALVLAFVHVGTHAANAPLRAYWVTRSSLDSFESIRRSVAAAAVGGFDAIMVPVGLMAEASPSFDGALEMVKEARGRGLRVHAWIEVTLAAAAGELPAARDHVLYRHPEWLMVPRELATDVLNVEVRSPAYLGRLTRWVRVNTPRIDGLYISPLAPEAAAYLVTAVTAAAQRYAVDGVFLDAMRFPGADFDYSRHAMEIFRAEMRAQLSPEERIRLDEIESIDPFGYAEEFPDRWRQFRQSRLTSLMSRMRKALATVKPTLVISAGVASDPGTALADSFQDWTNWMETGLIDGVARRSGTSGTIVFTTDGWLAASGSSSDSQTTDTGTTR